MGQRVWRPLSVQQYYYSEKEKSKRNAACEKRGRREEPLVMWRQPCTEWRQERKRCKKKEREGENHELRKACKKHL